MIMLRIKDDFRTLRLASNNLSVAVYDGLEVDSWDISLDKLDRTVAEIFLRLRGFHFSVTQLHGHPTRHDKVEIYQHPPQPLPFSGSKRNSLFCNNCGMEAYVHHRAPDTENDPNYQPRYCTACGSTELEVTGPPLGESICLGPYVLWVDEVTGLVRCHDERTNEERLCVL